MEPQNNEQTEGARVRYTRRGLPLTLTRIHE